MSKQQFIDRMALIREALRILDGEAPEELVVEGDGWSLIDPESVRRDGALEATTVAEVPLPPGRLPLPEAEAPMASLLDAMHEALDAAIDEGWSLEAETESASMDDGWALDEDDSRATSAAAERELEPAPGEVESDQERAFFAAGDAITQGRTGGDGAEYADDSPLFWRRFWARSA